MYIVSYSYGQYEENYIDLFVTRNEEYAKMYIDKFNTVLRKWKEYYAQFEIDGWINDEHTDKYFTWYRVKMTNEATYKEIEER